MGELARLFIHIAFLRRGPEEVPRSIFLLVALNAAMLALNAAFVAILGLGVLRVVSQMALNMGLSMLLTGAILSIGNRGERFVQSATAIAGAELILAPFGCLLLALERPYPDGAQLPDGLLVAEGLFLAWDITVIGHVYRRALERPLVVGVLLSFACAIIVLSTVSLVFPTSAP